MVHDSPHPLARPLGVLSVAALLALAAGCRQPENAVASLDTGGLGCDLLQAPTWYGDADGDGYGGTTFSVTACTSPGDDWVDNAADCDDLDADTNPGADELCDEVDNDCDEAVDEAAIDQVEYFIDEDGDGFGGDLSVWACDEPLDAIDVAGDCDDADPAVRPDAIEVCNDGIDNDCDGSPVPCLQPAADAPLILSGVTAGARGGVAGGMAGDLNGDGEDDLVVHASGDTTSGTDAGASYVFFGPVTDRGEQPLSAADLRVLGEADMQLGIDHPGEGDLDGDGQADLIVPGYRGSGPHEKSGTVFIFHGPVDGDLDVTIDVGASRIEGENAWDRAGYRTHVLGDFDGDAIDDIAVGAPYYRPRTSSDVGAVYLVSGGFDPGATIDLADAPARFAGSLEGQSVGHAVGGGDFNGDGQADLLVGASSTLTAYGAVHIIPGTVTPSGGDLADQQTVTGDRPGLLFGSTVEGGGDVDGDGYDDLLVGAPGYDSELSSGAGAVYVLRGGPTGVTATTPGEAHAVIYGAESDGRLGRGVAGGDWDGDGRADLLLGADAAGPFAEGMAYLVLGSEAEGTLAVEDVAEASLVGELASDSFGSLVSFVDADGDGQDELLVGADGSDVAGADAGRAYLFVELGL
jgi:hypothetical protein